MSVVVVTHELSSIDAIADRVSMLAGGQIIAQGSLREVKAMAHPELRAFFDRVGHPSVAGKSSVLAALEDQTMEQRNTFSADRE